MPSLVKWAVESLSSLKVEEAAAQFIELLKDELPGIRWVAAVVLGRIGRGSAEAAAGLRGSLQDADGDVREAAAWALSQVERAAPNRV